MTRGSIYREALALFGRDAQLTKTVEECLELGIEAGRLRDGRGSEGSLAEEIADVEIMCRQLRILVGDSLVEDAIARKLLRLDGVIKTRKLDPQRLGKGE
jgi:NTP pyrophosphatase (non-canonical NTP hydrolase)